ncbi:tRNA (adenosine(37)-N6)-threonylcarbamoyltransferase complex dimerization subunit type 1 TsaB [Aquibacillus halophilus]|uniref:tRNA (Adenosine(37)-N6)-threonylcarbamoyltransferase complex dimerization subunit type 1 TsaB n=1 Tax=Aquibacillus halophilus TaxID=930132 RepID=A0A6A8DGQ8_9BACI|nr:tRNA (adenosine(37)-N6)-threonylcarbamoyltransferase complex dimerization subunit type 1 TsaB [Aquibacillus halophilus]MRH44878.1 tRNA (adenosine(37)-N6)-threonylcarbamoyltransferase complex dimerization subunit type 1 TsaB [Aquibacillus halophilus]
MNILSIDTSNQTMGIAIVKDGQLAGEYITNVKKNHSVRLMPAIDQLMRDTETSPEDLKKIVVAKGPGSFTGIRIGLSTAKTMAWALKIPVVAVSSLEAVAYQGSFFDQLICPFFDARRGLVYTGVYRWNASGELEHIEEEKNIMLTELLDKLAQQKSSVLFLSQDIELHRDVITQTMGDKAIIPESSHHVPRPSLLAQVGADKDADELHTLTPNYLRLAEAEANWLKQQQGKD